MVSKDSWRNIKDDFIKLTAGTKALKRGLYFLLSYFKNATQVPFFEFYKQVLIILNCFLYFDA